MVVFELNTFLLWRIHCCFNSQPRGWISLSPTNGLPVKPYSCYCHVSFVCLEASSASAIVCGNNACQYTWQFMHIQTGHTCQQCGQWPGIPDGMTAVNMLLLKPLMGKWRNKKSPVTPLFPYTFNILYLCSSFLSSCCLQLLGWTTFSLQFLPIKF
jgi:hypothetical protein